MLYVIGGQQVYRAFLPLAERLYITQVEEEFPGDAWFPVIDDREWRVASSTAGVVDAKNPHPHRFVVYERLPS
jgi:dihydrofolate reductase